MLRSLVGSEMCIRDRLKTHKKIKRGYIGVQIVPLTEEYAKELGLSSNEGCLLYTSDAADDLLCVDLGGRRIIKKKKQQKSTENQTNTWTDKTDPGNLPLHHR